MKIIFAEDTELIQRMYGRVFEEAGIEMIALSDGSQVVNTALQERPEVIVLDVMMPNVNGLEALKAVKANPGVKDIPVVMLSAYQEDQKIMEAMNSGANRYLLKSDVEPAKLVEILKEIIGQPNIGASETPSS